MDRVSGILVLTAVLIQLTFYREIKLGPLLGMTKRPYWEIIYDRPPDIPDFVREKNLPPKMWDARLPLSLDQKFEGKLGRAPKGTPKGGRFADSFYGAVGWSMACILFCFIHFVGTFPDR